MSGLFLPLLEGGDDDGDGGEEHSHLLWVHVQMQAPEPELFLMSKLQFSLVEWLLRQQKGAADR